MNFYKALNGIPVEEEVEETVTTPLTPQQLATMTTPVAEPMREPASIPAPEIPQSAPVSEEIKLKTQIPVTAPVPQQKAVESPESRLERLMNELNTQRTAEREDAESRKFKADIVKAFTDNIGTYVGGMQAKNTKASVTPVQTRGYDVGDLVGQVDKRFAGDREALMDQYKNLIASKNRAEDVGFKKRELDLREKEINKKSEKAAPDDFNKSQMGALGKSSAEYYTKDRDQLISNKSKLDEGIRLLDDAIKSKSNLSGGISETIMPGSDLLRPIINKEGEIVKNSIDSAITETLRPTLGAQFTEQEGERIKALQYNPKLSPTENARRARELQKFIDKKVQMSDALYEHLGKGGKVQDFNFKQYGMAPGSAEGQDSPPKNTIRIQGPSGQVAEVSTEAAEKYLARPGYKRID